MILVLNAAFSNEGLGESAHMQRLPRALAAHIHKEWMLIKIQPKIRP